MLKVSETFSQVALGFEVRGTDFFLPILYDLNNKISKVNEHDSKEMGGFRIPTVRGNGEKYPFCQTK